MRPGPLKLRSWLRSRKIQQIEFAKIVSCTPITLNMILRGTRRPGDVLKRRIYVATSGGIEPNDWFDLEAEFTRDGAPAINRYSEPTLQQAPAAELAAAGGGA